MERKVHTVDFGRALKTDRVDAEADCSMYKQRQLKMPGYITIADMHHNSRRQLSTIHSRYELYCGHQHM